MRVLVVEDNRKTAAYLGKALKAEGFATDVLHDGDEALATMCSAPFDCAVLDIMLAGRDGLSVLRQARTRGCRTPVLLLSAPGGVNERIEGLNAGAADYMAKPFVLEELIARVRALVRRSGEAKAVVLKVDGLTLETTTRVAQRNGPTIDLTGEEFRFLEDLMRSAGRVCTRMMILEKVWDYSFDPGSNIVDVYARKLREKIDGDGEHTLLHTIRGAGYMFKEPI